MRVMLDFQYWIFLLLQVSLQYPENEIWFLANLACQHVSISFNPCVRDSSSCDLVVSVLQSEFPACELASIATGGTQ